MQPVDEYERKGIALGSGTAVHGGKCHIAQRIFPSSRGYAQSEMCLLTVLTISSCLALRACPLLLPAGASRQRRWLALPMPWGKDASCPPIADTAQQDVALGRLRKLRSLIPQSHNGLVVSSPVWQCSNDFIHALLRRHAIYVEANRNRAPWLPSVQRRRDGLRARRTNCVGRLVTSPCIYLPMWLDRNVDV